MIFIPRFFQFRQKKVHHIFTLWEPGMTKVRDQAFNTVMTTAKNDALEVLFRGGTQKSSWFMGLIADSGFSAISAADTISSHAGWLESVDYSNSTRVQWSPSVASGGSINNNASPCVFNMNATVQIRGVFMCSNSTKGGTSGILWSAGAFNQGIQQYNSGDAPPLTYKYTL